MSNVSYIDNGLYVADVEYVREQSTTQFTSVVDVCNEVNTEHNVSDDTDFYWFPLFDGDKPQCSYQTFSDAVDNVYELAKSGGHILVHCYSARSRSVAVIATVLALMKYTSFNSQYLYLKDRHSGCHIKTRLQVFARRYLAEHTSIYNTE